MLKSHLKMWCLERLNWRSRNLMFSISESFLRWIGLPFISINLINDDTFLKVFTQTLIHGFELIFFLAFIFQVPEIIFRAIISTHCPMASLLLEEKCFFSEFLPPASSCQVQRTSKCQVQLSFQIPLKTLH